MRITWRIEAAIGKEKIGAESEGEPPNAVDGRAAQSARHVFRVRREQDGGRATDAIGRPARQRFILPHFFRARASEVCRGESGIAGVLHV